MMLGETNVAYQWRARGYLLWSHLGSYGGIFLSVSQHERTVRSMRLDSVVYCVGCTCHFHRYFGLTHFLHFSCTVN